MITTESRPAVYIVNEPVFAPGSGNQSYDVSPALKFASIIRKVFQPGRLPADPAQVVAQARESLRGFRETDFLLLMGDPVAIAVATTAAADETGGRVQLLRWESRAKEYRLVEVDLTPPDDEDEPSSEAVVVEDARRSIR